MLTPRTSDPRDINIYVYDICYAIRYDNFYLYIQ